MIVQWIDSGISVFFFPRNAIPSDITSGAPQPSTWGTPMAFWPASTCNTNTFFSSHSAIFNIALWYVNIFVHALKTLSHVVLLAAIGLATNGAAVLKVPEPLLAVNMFRTTAGHSVKHVSLCFISVRLHSFTSGNRLGSVIRQDLPAQFMSTHHLPIRHIDCFWVMR